VLGKRLRQAQRGAAQRLTIPRDVPLLQNRAAVRESALGPKKHAFAMDLSMRSLPSQTAVLSRWSRQPC